MTETLTVTDEFIQRGSTSSRVGTWTNEQLVCLGVPLPRTKGWRRAAIGRRISGECAALFLSYARHAERPKSGPPVSHEAPWTGLPVGVADMEITNAFIHAGRLPSGGWTAPQMALLGVPWPPTAGWKRTVIGRRLSREQAEAFLSHRSTKR